MNNDRLSNRLAIAFVFSIAFAWVESAVVVYLREIYFNGNFDFPIKVIWENGQIVLDQLSKIELFREFATIVMLITAGMARGRNSLQSFCYFMFCFGVWDIFYYVWLKVQTGWPEGLMVWDLLFLLPLPWVGPVITPVLISVALISSSVLLLYYDHKRYRITLRWYDFAIEGFLGLLVIAAFCWDWKNILQIGNGVARDGIPRTFAWWLCVPSLTVAVIYFCIRLRLILKNNFTENRR